MTPKRIKLPSGEIVPVLGWVKDLYRIPGGHIKMSLAKPADDQEPKPLEVVEAIGTTVGNIIAEITEKPKGKGGRPRKVKPE